MHQQTRTSQDLNLNEKIHYPNRCSFPDCIDDIIPAPNGIDLYCFKYQINPDL